MYDTTYNLIADALVKKGYIVIENGLKQELSESLFREADSLSSYKKAGISAFSSRHIDASRRRDKIFWIEGESAAEKEYLEFAQGLQKYLNRSLYLGLSYYESHFALYEEGDFYEKHVDAFRGSKNRVLTTVYYLNEAWSEEDGGELLLYDAEGNLLQKVLPKANTLVVFLSDKFPHEVRSANKNRYSIAGWFRVDKRV